jgi:trimethylamine:corrinoid methyltransferase-like protein
MNHFDYLNSINHNKDDIMVDDITEKAYKSYYMNRHHHIDDRLQYDFMRNIVRKRKRFSKWTKADKMDALDSIKEYYGYSNQRAREVLKLIPKEHLDHIRFKLRKGGKN